MSRILDANNESALPPGLRFASSRVMALNIEFVAKPDEAHNVHAALPSAISGALGEVDGFAGSFVLIANHEARLVTVVTLWSGENRTQRCDENLRWVRALVAPYLDRCLRIQTFAAYVPATRQISHDLVQSCADIPMEGALDEEHVMCAA